MDILSNPYVYSGAAAALTSGLCLAFVYLLDPAGRKAEDYRKSGLRVFLVALIANFALQYFVNAPEPVATEPYAADSTAADMAIAD